MHHSIVRCTKYFDILNRLGVDDQCSRRTDRQNYDNNSVRLTTCAKNLQLAVELFIVQRTVNSLIRIRD